MGGRGVRVLGGSGAGGERGRSGLGREAERRRGLVSGLSFPAKLERGNTEREVKGGGGGGGGYTGTGWGQWHVRAKRVRDRGPARGTLGVGTRERGG